MDTNDMLNRPVSRRNILINAGIAGLAAAAAGGLNPFSRAEAKGASADKWPWPYVKLDPQKTADLAYEEWYRVFCGAAVINSVFKQLREKVGEPYKSFPSDAFVFLEGGMVGWGTVCGSNAGANIVSNLIIGPRIAGPDCEHGHSIGASMMEWYSSSALPVYTPKTPKQQTVIDQTTSGSPLCHVSVGTWMKKTGFPLASPERKDRCARVAASVAQKLVQDLNAWKDGKYQPASNWTPGRDLGITAQQNCTDCHGDKVPAPPMAKK